MGFVAKVPYLHYLYTFRHLSILILAYETYSKKQRSFNCSNTPFQHQLAPLGVPGFSPPPPQFRPAGGGGGRNS